MDIGQKDGDWVEGLAMSLEWQWLLLDLAPHHRERERERDMKYYYLRNLVLFLWGCKFIKKKKEKIYI